MELTASQRKALDRLELAFRGCREAGLVFVGMDSNLLCYDAASLIPRGDRNPTGTEFYNRQVALEGGITVNASGCYLDSGGW